MTLQLRKFNAKAILFDYDFLAALSTDKCMYCLSPVTVQLCISMLEMAGWNTRYFSVIGTGLDQDVIDQWSANAQAELMADQCVDATAINYVTQVDIDNQFNSWSTATSNTQINIYAPVTTFNTTSGETTAQDDFRLSALCYACSYWVDAACEAMKQTIGQGVSLGNIIAIGLGIIAGVLAAASAPLTAGASLAVLTAFLSGCAFLGAGVFGFLSNAILNDASARTEVACNLFQQLTGLAPTKANFYAQAGSITTVNTNAGLIADGIALLINDTGSQEKQFDSFINLLGEGFVMAQSGYLPVCDNCGWCVEYEAYETAPDGWGFIYTTPTWVGTPKAYPASSAFGGGESVYITRTFASVITCEKISFEYGLSGDATPGYAHLWLYLSGTLVYESGYPSISAGTHYAEFTDVTGIDFDRADLGINASTNHIGAGDILHERFEGIKYPIPDSGAVCS
jgi:hypothetical protein